MSLFIGETVGSGRLYFKGHCCMYIHSALSRLFWSLVFVMQPEFLSPNCSYFHSDTMTVHNLYSQFLYSQHYSLLCWLVLGPYPPLSPSPPPPPAPQSNQIYHGTISPESPAAVANVGFSVLKSLTQSRTNHQSRWTAIPRACYDCEMNAFDSSHRLARHITVNEDVWIHSSKAKKKQLDCHETLSANVLQWGCSANTACVQLA